MVKRIMLFAFYIFQFIMTVYMEDDIQVRTPKPLEIIPNSAKRDNPNFVRDRKRDFSKPVMPPSWGSRYRPLYDPAWMDYCDPYHCNDYHKITCGLNRRKMKFKWFQSICHLILNNQCADYRGSLRYDPVETKFCRAYVMLLRTGCSQYQDCPYELDPVCAMSSKDNHIVLFKNECFMNAANCRNATLQEYDAVNKEFCNRHESKSNNQQIQID